jgi:hypothetical protein
MAADSKNKWRRTPCPPDIAIFASLRHQFLLADKRTNPQGTCCVISPEQHFRKKLGCARLPWAMTHSRPALSFGMPGASEEELSALPIWTFTLGVFALLTFGLTAVPSIICGHLALAKTKNATKGSLAKSVALVGLVIGYVGAAILGTWIILMARYFSSP